TDHHRFTPVFKQGDVPPPRARHHHYCARSEPPSVLEVLLIPRPRLRPHPTISISWPEHRTNARLSHAISNSEATPSNVIASVAITILFHLRISSRDRIDPRHNLRIVGGTAILFCACDRTHHLQPFRNVSHITSPSLRSYQNATASSAAIYRPFHNADKRRPAMNYVLG